MARKQGPRDFHEPWVVTKSKTHGACPEFPADSSVPEEIRAGLIDAWHRADRDADWIIWGSRLAEPTVCIGLTGEVRVLNDRRILAVSRNLGFPAGAPNQEDFAQRIVACVNACAGIVNPESFVKKVRQLLLEMVRNQTDHHDGRVLGLLARCVPPEELDPFSDEDNFA